MLFSPQFKTCVQPALSKPLDLAECTPWLRALLTTDGTLTLLIEALWGQSVRAEPYQVTTPWIFNEAIQYLNTPASPIQAADVRMRSTVLLLENQQPVAITQAVILENRLPHEFLMQLPDIRAGIGQAIKLAGIEHHREIFWRGIIPRRLIEAPALPQTVRQILPDELPARSYGIFINQQLVMLIAECFIPPSFQ